MVNRPYTVLSFAVEWIRCFWEYAREYRAHAIQKMVERDISFTEIDEVAANLHVIREYAEDRPHPSCLVLGFTMSGRPLHLVYSVDATSNTVYVITVYEPDVSRWTDGFSRRSE